MAIKLQDQTIVVRRSNLGQFHSLSKSLPSLRPEGGILGGTRWYDTDLFCELGNGYPLRVIRRWSGRGIFSLFGAGRRRTQYTCLALGGSGPEASCDWLDYDPDDNSVWLKGSEKLTVVGGQEQFDSKILSLGELEASAERSYDAMYDSRCPKDDFEDAAADLYQAIMIARFLHLDDVVSRLHARREHIRAVYNHQFRTGWSSER